MSLLYCVLCCLFFVMMVRIHWSSKHKCRTVEWHHVWISSDGCGEKSHISWETWTKIKNKGALHNAKLNIIISRMCGGSGCAVEELEHWKDKCSWFSFVVVMVYKVIENTDLMNIEQHIVLKGNTGLGSWETLVNQSIHSPFYSWPTALSLIPKWS